MGHFADPDELFEFFGHELRSVVADDPRPDSWIALTSLLEQHDLGVGFGHGFGDVPAQDCAAASV